MPDNPSAESKSTTSSPAQPAPSLPEPGAMQAAPLTGSGPHHSAPEQAAGAVESSPSSQSPAAVPVPPVKPPTKSSVKSTQPEGVPAAADLPALLGSNGVLQPSLQTLIREVLNNQRQVDQRFFVVVVPEDDWPEVREFADVQMLLQFVRSQLGKPVHLFPFMGSRMTITGGEYRFLKTPLGALPLFELPTESEADEAAHGWVGPEDARLPVTGGEGRIDEQDEESNLSSESPVTPPPMSTNLFEAETPVFDDLSG